VKRGVAILRLPEICGWRCLPGGSPIKKPHATQKHALGTATAMAGPPPQSADISSAESLLLNDERICCHADERERGRPTPKRARLSRPNRQAFLHEIRESNQVLIRNKTLILKRFSV
jgi:hypothetical protein